jgi:tetratricopeptide (TPR) repeat protein
MTLRRNHGRLVCWTSPLWSSLLLAGCDSVPRSLQEPVALESAIEARVPTASALRPCMEPALLPPSDERTQVLAASHPAPQDVERLPLIPHPFPAADPGVPLSAMLQPPATLRAERLRPAPLPAVGPTLLSPRGAATEPEFGPPPPPRLSEMEVRALQSAAEPTRIRSTPASSPLPALQAAPKTGATPSAAPPRRMFEPQADVAAPARIVESAPEVRHALPLDAARHGGAPLAAPQPARSPEIEAVARQAERQVRRGYDLAARGALYSARSQFIQALRTIGQALDVQAGDRRHSEALSAGLGALEEAEDFMPRGSRLEADLDVGLLVQGHRTPVLKQARPEDLVAVVAQQRYYTYAQEQLTLAAGGEEAGSMALFGLGKTYGTLAAQRSPQAVAPEPKAMVFHQAALNAAPGNYLAANELAVLSARYGRYETARTLLQHSAALAPRPEIWRNLAIVHRRLGESKLADLAEKEAATAAEREAAGQLPKAAMVPAEVQWVDAKTFASTTKTASDLQKPAAGTAEPPAAEPSAAAPGVEARGAVPWLRQTSQSNAPPTAQR